MSDDTFSSDTAPRDPDARADLIAVTMVLVAAIYQAALIAGPLRFLCEHVLVDDDAYYYLLVARNLALDGRASFDGIHASNGVQLAWTVLLVPLARLVQGEIAYLRAALALGLVFSVLTGWQLARLGRRIHSPAAGMVAALVWCGAMLFGSPTLNAMEYSLDISVLVASIGLAWRLWRRPEETSRRRLSGGIALVALLFWTRLDAALLALLLAGVLARAVMRSSKGSARVLRLAALCAGGLVAGLLYLGAMQAMAGTWTPISGLAKQLHADRHFESHPLVLSLAGHALWWITILLRSALGLVAPWVQHGPLPRSVASVVAAATILGLLLFALGRIARRGQLREERELAAALLVLFAAGAAHAALLVVVLGHFAHVTVHYYGTLTLTLALGAGVLVARSSWPPARIRGAACGLFAIWLAAGVARVWSSDDGNLRVRRLALADWIDDHLPAEARLGAWNAGQLGYFSRRAVVNLDGLANDRDFLGFMRSRRPLQEYLDREGIDYLVDYNSADLSMPFRYEWDRAQSFRGEFSWSELDVVRADTSAAPPLYLVARRRAAR